MVLATRLQRLGFEVSVATFYPGGALESALAGTGVRLISTQKAGRWDVLGFARRLHRIVDELKPAVIQSFLGPPNIFSALLQPFHRGSRIVWGVRASDMDLSLYDYSWRLTAFLERRLSRIPDRIMVNSKAGLDYGAAVGLPVEKIVVISNGFDTEVFAPNPDARVQLRAEWGVSGDQRLIGMAARLDPIKDHEGFLRTAALLKDDSTLRFVCVGGGQGEYVEALKQLARTLGLSNSIIWAGERQDMPAVYNAFDIHVLSSLSEGLSNAVGEAMASGIPCVTTDVGDCPSLVGDTGFVVPIRDPNAMAEALRLLLGEGQQGLAQRGASARQRVMDRYSPESMARDAAALYRSLIMESPCPTSS